MTRFYEDKDMENDFQQFPTFTMSEDSQQRIKHVLSQKANQHAKRRNIHEKISMPLLSICTVVVMIVAIVYGVNDVISDARNSSHSLSGRNSSQMVGEQSEGNQVLRHTHIQQQLTDKLGFPVVIPQMEDYAIKYIGIKTPPKLNGETVGLKITATIVYTKHRGEKIELTKKQQNRREQQSRRKVLYGRYQGTPLMTLMISNMQVTLHDTKQKNIQGVAVAYKEIKTSQGKVAFSVLHTPKGSYQTRFILKHGVGQEEVFAFNKKLIKQLHHNGQLKDE